VNRRAIAVGLIVLVVALCAWPVVAFSMRHYLPEVDNDEVMYFLLVKVFRSQGFHGGYSFVNDRIPASAVHFDMHGPGTVLVYSSLARLVGWTNYSPYLANLLMFVPAWLALACALRHRVENQIAIACFVLANGCFFIFLPSAMQESFHMSVAVALAALWYVALEHDSTAAWLGLCLVVAVAIVVRYSWGVVIPCVVFSFAMRRASLGRTAGYVLSSAAVALAAGGIASVVAVKLLLWLAVPAVPSMGGTFNLPRVAHGFSTEQLRSNLSALVHFRMMRMFADYPKFFLVSFGLMLAVLAAAVVKTGDRRTRMAAIYGLALMGFSLGAQLLFYSVDGWRELRLLAPVHALAGLMFFAYANLQWESWSAGTRQVVIGVVLFIVVINGLYTEEGLELKYWSNWRHQTRAIDDDGRMVFAALAPYFEFRPDDSSFCKTAYGDSEVLSDPRLVYLPDGFALSVLEPDADDHLPRVRGKFAIVKTLRPDVASRFDWAAAFSTSRDWRRIAASEDFTLYRSTMNCLS
jgi:hypothetical protein